MPRRPVIGVAPQSQPPKPGELPLCWIMGARYVDVLRQAGAVPWIVPLLPHDKETMDGNLLPARRRLSDRRRGRRSGHVQRVETPGLRLHRPGPRCRRNHAAQSRPRNAQARARGLPGDSDSQRLLRRHAVSGHPNPSAGGDEARSLPVEGKFPSRQYLSHDITVTPNTRLRSILEDAVVPVNSMHHQAIKDLAPGLRPNCLRPGRHHRRRRRNERPIPDGRAMAPGRTGRYAAEHETAV